MRNFRALIGAALLLASPAPVLAQAGSTEALAQKFANPISDLISVPFQNNYDCCFGPADGDRYLLNFQPVYPTKLNADWNLIIRTIVPVVYLESPAIGLGDTFGLGDTLQSFFFSPRSSSGLTWGVGPAIDWPTGTDTLIKSGKWSAGPTFVILKQQSGWTYGVLTHHIWSFADAGGSRDRPEVSSSFYQPFLACTWKDSTTLTLNSESSYNGRTQEWEVPQPHLQFRRSAGQPADRRALVCRHPSFRARLGPARHGDLPVSQEGLRGQAFPRWLGR